MTVICLALCFTISFPSQAVSDDLKKILVMHSYHQGLVWTDDIMEGIYSIFYNSDIEMHIEYLDTKRYFDGFEGKYLTRLRDMYKDKYGAMKLDMIISSDDNAFQFLLMYHDELFPGTPIVFCGVNDFENTMLTGHDLVTGVIEFLDQKASIDIAVRLHPEAKEIFIITDTSTTGKGNRKIIKQLAEEYRGKVDVVFIDKDDRGLTLEELTRRLSLLKEGSIIYYSDFLRSRDKYIVQEIAVPQISRASRNPIYTHYDEILGIGVVGGKLVNGRSHGQKAAQIASRILQGAPVSTIPVYKESINTYMFDYEQLTRFNIDEKQLPEGSIVINRPSSFYSKYKALVWTITGTFALLIFSLAAISVNVIKRNKAENELKKMHNELEDKVEERTNELSKINLELQREIGERKHAEAERERMNIDLEQKNKELEQVVYIASHDLRTPLINIEGFRRELDDSVNELLSFLQNDNVPHEVKEKSASIVQNDIPEAQKYIQRSISKMDSLLSGLLKVSRIGSNGLPMEELDMNSLMSEVIILSKSQIDESDVNLEISDLPSCKGNESQINQVFSNIMENALKYIDPERPSIIKISGYKENGQSVYCIEDNGVGIASEHQEKIFDIFHQVKPKESKGEGLGLTIVKKIIGTHHGEIWLESAPGKGSKFYVALPEA